MKVEVPNPTVIASPPLQQPLGHELFEQVVIACDPISEQDLCFWGQKPCLAEKLKSQHRLKQRTLWKSRNSSLLLRKIWRNKGLLSLNQRRGLKLCLYLLFLETRIILQFIFYGIWKFESKSIRSLEHVGKLKIHPNHKQMLCKQYIRVI